ncbi:MAG TPA: DmsE family decaheme c-type cytochrome [Candidatus Solibacter sp.]|nr:DmsE family decaheme c-type cytochrome [Candidatus Solibacter sp.]
MRNRVALAMVLVVIAAGRAKGQGSAASLPAGYAGSEMCGACHEDLAKEFPKNPHHAVETDRKRGWEGRACEACHGPGQKHTESTSADDIRNPSKLAAAATNKICLTCHLGQPTLSGRLQNSHAVDQVACTTCHKIHANGPHGSVPRTATKINGLCAECHTNVVAQFQKPYHHRVPEAAMSCVDCHNPHGSIRPAMTQIFAANEPGCLGCHGDKRGPFTFEHAVVRFEGCAACHEPHGSANPRMLTRPVVQQVCLECHANLPAAVATRKAMGVVPPSFHDLRSPRYQNCTVCHQKVHGSYVDRNLLR